MRNKFIFAGIAGLTVLALATPADARINQRQSRQQTRIANGLNSGALTPREGARLERREGRIDAYEARSRADGGGLSVRERYRLGRMQNRTSRAIYRQKNDAQTQ